MKSIFILFFSFLIVCSVYSQEENKEDIRKFRMGLRGVFKGDGNEYWGGDFSFQIYLKGMRRLELNFGSYNSMEWDLLQFTGIYQWRLIRKGGFSAYTGPGLGFGYANYGYGDDNFYGVLAANIGVDYTFKFPIQIGLDWRPEYSVLNEYKENYSNQFGLAIRLAF